LGPKTTTSRLARKIPWFFCRFFFVLSLPFFASFESDVMQRIETDCRDAGVETRRESLEGARRKGERRGRRRRRALQIDDASSKRFEKQKMKKNSLFFFSSSLLRRSSLHLLASLSAPLLLKTQ